MTDSPQAATAAAPADAPADEESLYQATIQALDAPEKETSTLRKAALLIGTLALSVAAFLWLGFPLLFLLILIGVLLFHELGHYLGMQLFGYRDVRMFFIPFLGAAVSGRKYAAPVWQEATMLLLGPLPGLALAVALTWLYEPAPGTELYVLVWMLAYVNAFNLVPVTPLDGGRLVNLLFFARQPYLAAGFQLLAGGALLTYAWLNSELGARHPRRPYAARGVAHLQRGKAGRAAARRRRRASRRDRAAQRHAAPAAVRTRRAARRPGPAQCGEPRGSVSGRLRAHHGAQAVLSHHRSVHGALSVGVRRLRCRRLR